MAPKAMWAEIEELARQVFKIIWADFDFCLYIILKVISTTHVRTFCLWRQKQCGPRLGS